MLILNSITKTSLRKINFQYLTLYFELYPKIFVHLFFFNSVKTKKIIRRPKWLQTHWRLKKISSPFRYSIWVNRINFNFSLIRRRWYYVLLCHWERTNRAIYLSGKVRLTPKLLPACPVYIQYRMFHHTPSSIQTTRILVSLYI